MIKSDRRARMMLGCAMDGGDLAVADLVQHLGAEEPGRRSPRAHWESRLPNVLLGFRSMSLSGWPKPRHCASSLPAMTSGRMGLMIFAMPRASSGVAGSRWDCGYAVLGIWLI